MLYKTLGAPSSEISLKKEGNAQSGYKLQVCQTLMAKEYPKDEMRGGVAYTSICEQIDVDSADNSY